MGGLPASIYKAFADTAARHPDNAFLCVPARADRPDWPEGTEFTYADVLAQVGRLRENYAAAGYGLGHRVGLLLDMRPEFFFHYLALNGLGCSIVPINPDYRHDEMLYQMQHSEADLAVVLPDRMRDVSRVASARPEKPLPVIDGLAGNPDLPRPLRPAISQQAGNETECSLLYTSGTTGRPKGCILTNFYYLNAGAWYRDFGGLLTVRHGAERFYNPLPLFHMNHQAVTVSCAILTANCLILPERFSPSRWWGEVVQTRATIVHYLGVVPPLLLNQPVCSEERQHRVRFGLGAGVEPLLHRSFEDRFGFPLVEVWGMTETGRIFADAWEPRRTDTRAFGRPMKGFEAKVVDEAGREVERGQEGEMLVRFAGSDPRQGFFSGYLKNPEATEEAWAGGWFHTGDVVRIDGSGMIYFVDRRKNIIRRAGENIAAAEIEAVLQAHPAVAQVAVIAVPDELREEEVMACIVAMPGHAADAALAEEIFTWCSGKLAYFKAPGWMLFVDRLPTTGTQKVQKAQIFAVGEDPRIRPDILDFRSRKRRPSS